MRVISGSAKGTILQSIDDIATRPTLDRVKESLFNIINNRLDEETKCIDLFAGSGAIGIEFLSRGVSEVVFCDKSKEAIKMINKNLTKTKLISRAKVISADYQNCLNQIKNDNQQYDIIYIDPPYKKDVSYKSVELISKLDLLKKDGLIIIETDELERDIKQIKENLNIKYEVADLRKYGRAHLIFLNERGE